MKNELYTMPPIAMNASAVEKNEPVWERNARNWQKLDRLELTEKQAVRLTEKVIETSYFSSEYLLNPSLPEFIALIQEKDTAENTYVAYRPALLGSEDIRVEMENGVKRTIIPAVDAYVYINNTGMQCNFVLTLARCVLEHAGERLNSNTQFISWQHDDPYTNYLIRHDEEYFAEFARTIKGIFLAIQMLSLERPEVIVRGTVREERQETVKAKGRYKKVRKTSMVRTIRLTEAATAQEHHTITCPSWSVAGHKRRYKNGKEVWIKPYRKGRERNNPEAFQPKEYEFSKEICL